MNHPWLGMVTIPPMKMVMTGGWFMIVIDCFTQITSHYYYCNRFNRNLDEIGSFYGYLPGLKIQEFVPSHLLAVGGRNLGTRRGVPWVSMGPPSDGTMVYKAQ